MAAATDPKPKPKPKPQHARSDSAGYQLVHQDEEGSRSAAAPVIPRPTKKPHRALTMALCAVAILLLASILYLTLPLAFNKHDSCPCAPSKVPQYFQTKPNLWPGVTATGRPAFMAQTRVFEPTATYVPNEPLQTSIPIDGMKDGDQSIFDMMGYLSPYKPATGFGVDEYPIPKGAEIVQVQMLSRHGARYPTPGSETALLGDRIANATSKIKTKGPLAFLGEWKYLLGNSILVPKGREELYRSGVLHSYMYGSLYNSQSKIIARTTTQDRMLKSAENWLAGFFGLDWTNNATIEVIIEADGFNNSLAGSLNCPNSAAMPDWKGPQQKWKGIYLKDALARFQNVTEGFEWTIDDVYAAQMMCPYETVSYGFSKFCDLFTYEEWQAFGYSLDLVFSAGSGFHSPTGRAVGIGYQQEVIARLRNHTLGYSGSQINVTLDSSTETFPLNQSLYFDFSHDTNIISVLTAFGLTQFKEKLPDDRFPTDHQFVVANLTPFGARLDMEIIKTPKPLSANRDGYLEGKETKYIHFVLNQRTIPLGKSFPECGAERKDGWCELETFLKVQEKMPKLANFDHACFGKYNRVKFGDVTDGAPV